MKNFKRVIAIALTAAMVASVPAAAATEKATFIGRTKSGLERSVNGYAARYKEVDPVTKKTKFVRRAWKKAKEYGTWYWFYFDSDTLAVRAKAYKNYVNNVATHKIGDKAYGFDMYGHRVSGLWASVPKPGSNGMTSISGKFWYFNADGTYNKGVTKTYRALAEYLDKFAALKTKLNGIGVNEIEECYREKVNGVWVWRNGDFNRIFGALRTINNALFVVLTNTACDYVRRYTYDNFEVYTLGIKQGDRATVERVIAVTAVSKY